jgi:hypothetical protein
VAKGNKKVLGWFASGVLHLVYPLVDPRAEAIVAALRGVYSALLPASALLAVDGAPVAMTAATVAVRLAERGWM